MLTRFRLVLVLALSVALITTSFSSAVQPVSADLIGKIAVNVKLQNVNAATGPLIMNVTLFSDHTLIPVGSQEIIVDKPSNGKPIKFIVQAPTPTGQFTVCASEPLNGYINKCTDYPVTKHHMRVTFSVP